MNQQVNDNISNAIHDLEKALGSVSDEKMVAYYVQAAITSLNAAKSANKAAIRTASGSTVSIGGTINSPNVNIGGTQVFGGSRIVSSDDE